MDAKTKGVHCYVQSRGDKHDIYFLSITVRSYLLQVCDGNLMKESRVMQFCWCVKILSGDEQEEKHMNMHDGKLCIYRHCLPEFSGTEFKPQEGCCHHLIFLLCVTTCSIPKMPQIVLAY